MIRRCFLTLVLSLNFSSYAFADDLLNILGEKKTQSIVQESSDLAKSLKGEVGSLGPEANIFLQFLSDEKYEKALFQWWSAFEEKSFEKSPNGKALFAFLLFKNNMPIIALEHLFQVSDAGKIMPELREQWKIIAPYENQSWNYVSLNWSEKWTVFFDREIEVKVLSRQDFDPNNLDNIYDLLKKTKSDTKERHWLEWQTALSLALNNDTQKSAKVLAHLLNQKQDVVDKDLIHITVARLLYEKGFLSPAIKYYSKIKKSSEYWFPAQEEMAWSYMRNGEPQNTIAVTQTVTNPKFSIYSGPEAFFLRSLVFLKVCDYTKSIDSLRSFQTQFQTRVKYLNALLSNSQTPDSKLLFEKIIKGKKLSLKSLGPSALRLPSYVTRDQLLSGIVRTAHQLSKEVSVAKELYERSLSGGTARVGFQAPVLNLKTSIEKRMQDSQRKAFDVLKRRAREELVAINQIVQKMHIVEAEIIQQVHKKDSIQASTKTKTKKKNKSDIKVGTTGSKDKYALKFPLDSGESWFDEISYYKVDVADGCKVKKMKTAF